MYVFHAGLLLARYWASILFVDEAWIAQSALGTRLGAGQRRIFPWVRGDRTRNTSLRSVQSAMGAQSPVQLGRSSFSKTNRSGTETTTEFNNAWRGISTPPPTLMAWILLYFEKKTDVYCVIIILQTLYWKETGKRRVWPILSSSDGRQLSLWHTSFLHAESLPFCNTV
jgi:hypothetical protein